MKILCQKCKKPITRYQIRKRINGNKFSGVELPVYAHIACIIKVDIV